MRGKARTAWALWRDLSVCGGRVGRGGSRVRLRTERSPLFCVPAALPVPSAQPPPRLGEEEGARRAQGVGDAQQRLAPAVAEGLSL